LAALSTTAALITLGCEVDENSTIRNHLILVGMILVSFSIEFVNRGNHGAKNTPGPKGG